MLSGKTLTKTLTIEAKQHELFGLDLGEGVPRHVLFLGAGMVALWVTFLWLAIGPPHPQTVILYLLPPIAILVIGTMPYAVQPRRRVLTQWALKLRFMLTGSRAVIRWGQRPATRAERLPLRDRITVQQLRQLIMPQVVLTQYRPEPEAVDYVDEPIGAPIVLGRRPVRLYGPDATAQILQKTKKK